MKVVGHTHLRLMLLTKLLGLLVANMEAVQWGQLYSRDLQWFLKPYQMQIAEKTDMMLQVPFKVQNSLRWWTVSSNLSRGKLYPIVTNANLSGWGMVWKNPPVQETWSQKKVKSPVNLLELRAIRLAMLHFADGLKDKHVLMRTNIVAAKPYINKQRGSKSLALHKEAQGSVHP